MLLYPVSDKTVILYFQSILKALEELKLLGAIEKQDPPKVRVYIIFNQTAHFLLSQDLYLFNIITSYVVFLFLYELSICLFYLAYQKVWYKSGFYKKNLSISYRIIDL